MSAVIPLASDFYATIDQITDPTGAYVDGATVTVTVYAKDRTALAGPITANYVANSNGKYQALIPKATAFAVGKRYDFDFKVTTGTSEAHYWMKDAVCERYDP